MDKIRETSYDGTLKIQALEKGERKRDTRSWDLEKFMGEGEEERRVIHGKGSLAVLGSWKNLWECGRKRKTNREDPNLGLGEILE